MKESLDKILKKVKDSRHFFPAEVELSMTNELITTCKEFLTEFQSDYTDVEINKVASVDGVFLIDFSSNNEEYICKAFFDEVIESKETEVNILTAANGKKKTNMYPTEEMVESNGAGIIVYKEGAASFDSFPKQYIDTLMPRALVSQSLFHKIKAKTPKGSFLDMYESMATNSECPSIQSEYLEASKLFINKCYEKLKGGKKVVCLGSYEFKNFMIQEIGEYENRAVKFFNCWYSVKDYEAFDYAMMIQFASDEGADEQALYKILGDIAGEEVRNGAESIKKEVSNLAALTYYLFLMSESRDRAKYMKLFSNKVRASDDPKKFKKMVEKVAQ